MGPKKAVIEAESREEAAIISSFKYFRFTPKLCAYEVPKEFPINGFIDLKQKNSPINTKADNT
jgi:hypothetical protein